MSEVQIPWEVGRAGPIHCISGYVGGGPVAESYGVPEEYMRAAGWVPASEVTELCDSAINVLLAFEGSITQAHERKALLALGVVLGTNPQPSRKSAHEGEQA